MNHCRWPKTEIMRNFLLAKLCAFTGTLPPEQPLANILPPITENKEKMLVTKKDSKPMKICLQGRISVFEVIDATLWDMLCDILGRLSSMWLYDFRTRPCVQVDSTSENSLTYKKGELSSTPKRSSRIQQNPGNAIGFDSTESSRIPWNLKEFLRIQRNTEEYPVKPQEHWESSKNPPKISVKLV